jgi:hypothetical protein
MTRADSLLEQLERAERNTTGPPPEVADRMWAAIEERMAHGPPPPELVEPELDPTAAASRPALLKIVGAVTLVGVAAGLLALALDRDESESEPEAVATVEPESPPPPRDLAPTPTPVIIEPESIPAPEPIPAPDPEPIPEPEAKPSKPSGSKPVVQKGLAEELALMQAISTALGDGDSAKVLELVGEHRRDFPHGQFIEERSAAEARALCRRGKPRGKTKAEQFIERWPNSIHLASVRTDCEL